jgi:CheY-like chemotaxis protein
MHLLPDLVRKKRILLVEDNSDLRRLYAIGLNQLGYEVKLASNGAEAVDRIESESPDVIVLDLAMPVMNGWEVIERMTPGEASGTPVIIVSGQTPPVGDVLPPHIDRWLSKPVTLDELRLAIDGLVDRR